jgi:hypothetical protein
MTIVHASPSFRLPLRERVVSRFAGDTRYLPPRHILNGVDTGELDPKVLLIWKYVVEKMGPKFGYGGATAYWRSKCAKEGLDIPQAYMSAGEGATFGAFKIKSSDQIEDWVKERLRSAGLVSDTHKTAAEWSFEISHMQSMVDDAKERIGKHEKGLAEGNRVKQREKWLAEAKDDLSRADKELEAAKSAVAGLQEVIEKHEDVVAPVVDFEKQFQTMLHSALDDLSRKDVLMKAKSALAKFEAEMSKTKMASSREGNLHGDSEALGKDIGLLLAHAILWVVDRFEALGHWVSDLVSSTKRIDKLLESVS